MATKTVVKAKRKRSWPNVYNRKHRSGQVGYAVDATRCYLDRKIELRGGADQDQAEAQEWMSLFGHEAVVGEEPEHSKNRHGM